MEHSSQHDGVDARVTWEHGDDINVNREFIPLEVESEVGCSYHTSEKQRICRNIFISYSLKHFYFASSYLQLDESPM